MFLSALLFVFTTLAACTPIQTNPTNFFLVTTTQRARNHNSSHLTNVSATSLFDPFSQENYLLRLIGPGYLTLPRFNFTNGTLHTLSPGPHDLGEYEYNSTKVVANEELQFLPADQGKGNLGLQDGYMLTVRGNSEGWTICQAELEESAIYWKGNDSSCTKTFIHAVEKAPY